MRTGIFRENMIQEFFNRFFKRQSKRTAAIAPEVYHCTMCGNKIKGPVYLFSTWREGEEIERNERVCRECWLMVILPAGKA
jgi:ribosomal protein L37AE/L43A